MSIGHARDHNVRAKYERKLRVFPAVRLQLFALAAKGLRPEHGQVAVELVAADDRPAERVGDTHERTFLDVTGALHLVDNADRVRTVFLCDLAQLACCRIERGIPVGLDLFALFILNEWFRKAIGPMKNRIDRKTFEASARIVMLVRVIGRLSEHANLAILYPSFDAACARAVRRTGGSDPFATEWLGFGERLSIRWKFQRTHSACRCNG